MKKYIALMQCPVHSTFQALAIEEEDGSGLRLTPSKCCGSWRTVRRWEITRNMKTDLLQELEGVAE